MYQYSGWFCTISKLLSICCSAFNFIITGARRLNQMSPHLVLCSPCSFTTTMLLLCIKNGSLNIHISMRWVARTLNVGRIFSYNVCILFWKNHPLPVVICLHNFHFTSLPVFGLFSRQGAKTAAANPVRLVSSNTITTLKLVITILRPGGICSSVLGGLSATKSHTTRWVIVWCLK